MSSDSSSVVILQEPSLVLGANFFFQKKASCEGSFLE